MKTTGQPELHSMTSGFTLIELIVTIAIATILVTAGIPSFRTFVQDNRRSAQINALVHALQIARSEAIRQRTKVGVCASSNQTSCGTDWNDGWIVFVDKNNNNAADNGEVLNVFPGLDGGNSLTATLKSSPLAYQASGLSTTCGYFTLIDARGASASRWIIVSPTGAVRTGDTNDSTCTS